MEMQQVRYFTALAEHLNFTRAAEACNVTQPALTRAIQALEHELGGPLFHRERAHTHLSELGRTMLPYLQSIQRQSEAARAHAKSLGKVENAALKLGSLCTIGPVVLSDFIVQFHAKYGAIDFQVRDTSSEKLMEDLAKGDLEVALCGGVEPVADRFHTIELFRERFLIALPPNHRLAEKNAISVRDLNDEPYVGRLNCEIYDYAKDCFEQNGAIVKPVFRSERDDWVLAMIRAGLGFGFFPEFCTIPEGVITRPLIDPEIERTVSIVTVRGRPHSPAVGAFIRGAKAHPWPKNPPERAIGRAQPPPRELVN